MTETKCNFLFLEFKELKIDVPLKSEKLKVSFWVKMNLVN